MEQIVNAVFLDADSLGPQITLAPIQGVVSRLDTWPGTAPADVMGRLQGYQIALVNKVVLGEEHFAACPELKLVAVTATGVNNIDLDAARRHGVRVMNVAGYGTATVTQHTLALILALATRLVDYVGDVKAGAWQRSETFCLMHRPIVELAGKTLGIVGYGELGQGLAALGRALGMQILVAARPGQPGGEIDGVVRVPWSELLPRVDVLSLHCLLTEEARNMIDADSLRAMKNSAFLVNTARGGLVNEAALAEALRTGQIAGAAVDVLSEEPPRHGNPLLADDIPNLIVTPHSAWASREARQRVADMTADNLRRFLADDSPRFVV